MLDSSYLWAPPDPQKGLSKPLFDVPTLAYALFSPDSTIDRLFADFKAFLGPFSHYPWFHSPPECQMVQKNGVSYIYGEIAYGDNTSDERLVIYALWKFSEIHKNAYIQLFDSVDQDVLLVEHYKALPDWLGPENARNRAWINGGCLKLVSLEKDLISLEEVLHLIISSSEKLMTDETLTTSILDTFGNDTLLQGCNADLIYELELEIPAPVASFIALNPWAVSRSIDNFCKNDLSIVSTLSELPGLMNNDFSLVSTTIALPVLTLSLLRGLKEQLKREQPHIVSAFQDRELISRTILAGLDNLLQFHPEMVHNFNKARCSVSGSPRSRFLNALNSQFGVSAEETASHQLDPKNCFKDSIFDRFSAPDEEIDVPEEKIAEFFKDNEAGLEGIGNGPEKEKNDNLQALSGIDDDFFEFYARTYMQLSDEDLRQYVQSAKSSKKRPRKTTQLKEYNDDSDYHSDTSVEYGLEEGEGELDDEDLLEAIKQFKMTASDNPLARDLLRNGIGGFE